MDDETKLEKAFEQARSNSSVAYMEFISKRKYFKDYIFCFFEGQDDSAYYAPKINFEKTQFIVASSKKNVLQTLHTIRKESIYDNVNCMFFVDRDFTPSETHDDLYETPCYSFENFYVNEACYKQILKIHFHFNQGDKYFNEFLEIFRNHFKKFNEFILKYNAIVYLNAKEDLSKRISIEIDTKKLLKITIKNVTASDDYSTQIQKMKDQLNISETTLENTMNELNKKEEAHMFFRGKNQLIFFKKFLSLLKIYYQQDYKKKNNLKLNVTLNVDNNILNVLYSCAITPKNLKTFIDNHIKKFTL